MINAAGEIAFAGQTTNSAASIFLYSKGKIREVVRAGNRFGQDTLARVDLPHINDLGNIAFTADLVDGETAIFIARPKGEHEENDSEFDLETGSAPSRDEVRRLKIRDSRAMRIW